MTETTVWACKKCGRCSKGASAERCQHCSGTMAQIAESDAMKRFMEYWEPPTGWLDYETVVQDWNDDRVHVDARRPR
jgi:hypothetical protein